MCRPGGGGARRYRLTGMGAFAAVLRAGIRREGDWLQLMAAPARTDPGRVGFIVGKKALASAVARNRVKRVLRAAVARARPRAAAFDVILRLKRPAHRDEMGAIAAEAQQLLSALPEPDVQSERP